MARINGEFVINPTFEQLEEADMDLMVGATEENIMMVEGEMKEVPESALLEALKATPYTPINVPSMSNHDRTPNTNNHGKEIFPRIRTDNKQ